MGKSTWPIWLPMRMNDNNWYYIYLTTEETLPTDWNSAGANMASWDGQGPCPVGYLEEADLLGGTGLNLTGTPRGGTVELRKDFTVRGRGQGQPVWVYGMTGEEPIPSVWVNGTAVDMERITDRTDLTYWNYRADITSLVTGGTNYMVVNGGWHVDISGPVYRTDDDCIGLADLAAFAEVWLGCARYPRIYCGETE